MWKGKYASQLTQPSPPILHHHIFSENIVGFLVFLRRGNLEYHVLHKFYLDIRFLRSCLWKLTLVLKRNRFFFVMCPGYIQFFEILVVYEYFCLKTLNLGWFHELRKSKNIETHLVHRPGSRMGAEVRGPSLGTNMGFNFLIFRISWIPPKVFKCVCKIFVNTTKIIKKSMKYSSRNKKNMSVLYWNPTLVIFWTKIQHPPHIFRLLDLLFDNIGCIEELF